MEFFLFAIAPNKRSILSSFNSIAHGTAVGTGWMSETALCKSIIPSGNLNSSPGVGIVLHDRNFALTERLLINAPGSHGTAVGYGIFFYQLSFLIKYQLLPLSIP